MGQGKLARMYKTTLILLTFMVIAASYFQREFPFSVIIAVIACFIFEIAADKFLSKREEFRIPYTALISGIIIGCVAPSNASVVLLVTASAIAIASKFMVRYKGNNIFNPAVVGLLVALVAFGVGDNWWVTGPYPAFGVLLTFTPLLAICAYDARRLIVGVSFSVTMFVASLYMVGIGNLSASALWTAFISVNYLLAFIMLSEPKTSPNKRHVQAIYGVSIAIILSIMIFYRIPYALLIALVIGNIAYSVYRIKFNSR